MTGDTSQLGRPVILPKKLPVLVRPYTVGRKIDIPEFVVASLHRTVKSCWICLDDQKLRWEVRLPRDESAECPAKWEDEWTVSVPDRGPLVASGRALRAFADEKRRWQAEKAALIAQLTYERLRPLRERSKAGRDENRSRTGFTDAQSEWLSVASSLDLGGKKKLIAELSVPNADQNKKLMVLAAWIEPELREMVANSIRVFGPHRLIELLKPASGWPPDLLRFIDGFIYRPGVGRGIESFFEGHTEPHRE
jgi:hypothetical protein